MKDLELVLRPRPELTSMSMSQGKRGFNAVLQTIDEFVQLNLVANLRIPWHLPIKGSKIYVASLLHPFFQHEFVYVSM